MFANQREIDESEEQRPLLHDRREEVESPNANREGRKSPVVFVPLLILVLLLLDFGAYLTIAPQTRVFESIICRNHYDKNDPDRFPYPKVIPEDQCKISPVQSEVALVQALGASFDGIPGIILLLPYGRLADNPRFGRKRVLLLGMAGFLLNTYWTLMVCIFSRTLPLRMAWFGAFFIIIGGGLGVTSAMVTTMLADIVDAADRSTVFFQIALAGVVAQLVAPVLASALMVKHGPWLPYYIGVGFFTFSCSLLFLIPETINIHKPKADDADLPLENGHEYERGHNAKLTIIARYYPIAKNAFTLAWKESKTIFQNRTILILLSATFLCCVGQKQADVLLLYASTRYNLPLSKAGFIHSIIASVSIVLLLVILPAFSHVLISKMKFQASAKDLWLSKISVVFLTLGCFAIGLSPTLASMICALVVYTLGSGFSALCLGLISTFADPTQSARLYSVVILVGMLASFIGGPLIATLFNLGLKFNGTAWIGLPFFSTGVIHVFVVLALWIVKLPENR